MDKRPIFFVSHCSWETHYFQFYKEVANELGRLGHDVVWVDDRVRLRVDGIRPWLRAAFSGTLSRSDAMWRLRPWSVSRLHLGRRFTLPDRLVAHSIRRSARQLEVGIDVALVFTPAENAILRVLRPDHTVFWTGDEMTWHGTDWLIDNADAIFALSAPTQAEMETRRPGAVYRFPTGVPLERFVRAAEENPPPPELRGLPRPVFGYAGNISAARVDFAIIRELATRNPTASVVMVGPVDIPISLRQSMPPNVTIIGEQPYERVPSFLASFDVGLVPYLQTPFNIGSSPLKLHEYLGVGLPVVGTSIPSVVEYSDVAKVEDDPVAFAVAAMALAVTRHNEREIERRRKRVADVTAVSMAARMSEVFAAL